MWLEERTARWRSRQAGGGLAQLLLPPRCTHAFVAPHCTASLCAAAATAAAHVVMPLPLTYMQCGLTLRVFRQLFDRITDEERDGVRYTVKCR